MSAFRRSASQIASGGYGGPGNPGSRSSQIATLPFVWFLVSTFKLYTERKNTVAIFSLCHTIKKMHYPIVYRLECPVLSYENARQLADPRVSPHANTLACRHLYGVACLNCEQLHPVFSARFTDFSLTHNLKKIPHNSIILAV